MPCIVSASFSKSWSHRELTATATAGLILMMDAMAGARLGRAIPLLRETAAGLPGRSRAAAVMAVSSGSSGCGGFAGGGLSSPVARIGQAMHYSLAASRRAGEKDRLVVAVDIEVRSLIPSSLPLSITL